MKLTKGPIRVKHLRENRETFESAQVTPSGRWAMYKADKGVTVLHVPTGVPARTGMLHTHARAFLEVLEGLDTPVLDALPFGVLAETDEGKADLRKIANEMTRLRQEGIIR